MNELKLLYRTVHVRPFTPEEAVVHGVSGECSRVEGEIRYLASSDEAETADTILHETFHMLDNLYNILPKDMDCNVEERIVAQFATALTTTMKDNPSFILDLQGMINRGRGE